MKLPITRNMLAALLIIAAAAVAVSGNGGWFVFLVLGILIFN